MDLMKYKKKKEKKIKNKNEYYYEVKYNDVVMTGITEENKRNLMKQFKKGADLVNYSKCLEEDEKKTKIVKEKKYRKILESKLLWIVVTGGVIGVVLIIWGYFGWFL